jgi:hypothetical protein
LRFPRQQTTIRDWPDWAEPRDLKATDPHRCHRVLDSKAERRRVAPEVREPGDRSGRRSRPDALIGHFRRAFSLSDGQTSQLGYIRRDSIYACLTLREDMLSGLPLGVRHLGTSRRGRRVDVRDPPHRLAMPTFAIEDAARACRVPIEFIGGTRRMYPNGRRRWRASGRWPWTPRRRDWRP